MFNNNLSVCPDYTRGLNSFEDKFKGPLMLQNSSV